MRTWVVWRVLFVFAAVYFIWRGPVRGLHDGGDFLVVFSAARCWLHGENAYSPGKLAASAQAAGVNVDEAYFVEHPSLYPPTALAILAPVGLLDWRIARPVWITGLFVLSWWSIVAFARISGGAALPVACFLFVFAHLHTGISLGQPSVLVCGLVFLSLFTSNPYVSGALLGLAVLIKPQLAACFLALAIIQRQYRKAAAACAVGLFITGIAFSFSAQGSLDSLLSNLSQLNAPTSPNSSSPHNPDRYQLINISTLIPEPLYKPSILIGVSAAIILLSFLAVLRLRDERIAVALIASASVLVVYHHYYDAEILWLGIPAMSALKGSKTSQILWALYAVFLVPGQTIAARWFGVRSDGAGSWLLLNHETLAILFIWIIFLWISIRLGAECRGSIFREPAESVLAMSLHLRACRLPFKIIPSGFFEKHS